MDVPITIYLPYLLLTLAIETPLVFALLVRPCGWLRSALVALLASSVTHPLLWFVWSHVVSVRTHYGWYVATGEALVVFIEAGIFFVALRGIPRSNRFRVKVALGVSLLANSVSCGTGFVMAHEGWLQAYVKTVSGWLDTLLQ